MKYSCLPILPKCHEVALLVISQESNMVLLDCFPCLILYEHPIKVSGLKTGFSVSVDNRNAPHLLLYYYYHLIFWQHWVVCTNVLIKYCWLITKYIDEVIVETLFASVADLVLKYYSWVFIPYKTYRFLKTKKQNIPVWYLPKCDEIL